MAIKPIEQTKIYKPTKQPSVFRILALVVFVATGLFLNKIFLKKYENAPAVLAKIRVGNGSNLIKSSISKVQGMGGVVLGEATKFGEKIASDTGAFVSKMVYESTIGKLVEQIGKLPKDQQQRIRDQICR